MTKFMRYALIIESFFNISGATVFLSYPRWCLSYVVYPTCTLDTISTSSVTLFQIYACLVLALTLPLLQCIPETHGVAEKRAVIFTTLAAGEAFIIGLLLWKSLDPVSSGFSEKALLQAAGSLVPYLVWRVSALWLFPGLLRQQDVSLARKKL